MTDVRLVEREGGTAMTVRVVPRGGHNALAGVTEGGALKVRLAAPPVEGPANIALIAFLAGFCGVSKRAVAITYGHHGREKHVHIAAPPSVIEAKLRGISQ